MALILIADDEPLQRVLIRETLASEPAWRFVEAENGQQAWALVQQYHPQVAILDVKMPDVSGLDVCRRIKTNLDLQAIKVILLTALKREQDKRAAQETGYDEYLAKPFEAAELERAVQRLLGDRQSG